jgi:hypothetical protein
VSSETETLEQLLGESSNRRFLWSLQCGYSDFCRSEASLLAAVERIEKSLHQSRSLMLLLAGAITAAAEKLDYQRWELGPEYAVEDARMCETVPGSGGPLTGEAANES